MAQAASAHTISPSEVAAMNAATARYLETQLFRPFVEGSMSLDQVERLIERATAYRDAILVRRAS